MGLGHLPVQVSLEAALSYPSRMYVDKGRWGSLEPQASSNRSHSECQRRVVSMGPPTRHTRPTSSPSAGGSCAHCQGRRRGWRPTWLMWTFPGQQEGGNSKQNGFSSDGCPGLGAVTKATPTLGDTVGVVAELAWLGLRPPWAGQAGQRAFVLWLLPAWQTATGSLHPQGPALA